MNNHNHNHGNNHGNGNNTVLSICLRKPAAGWRENHARYAACWGYVHRVVDLSHVPHDALALIAKWQAVYDALSEQRGGAVLVLSDRAMVYRGYALADVFGDVPYYLAGVWEADDLANTDAVYLRPDGATRAAVLAVFSEMRALVAGIAVPHSDDPWLQEARGVAEHLQPAGVHAMRGAVAPVASLTCSSGYLSWGSHQPLPALVCTTGLQVVPCEGGRARGAEDVRLMPLLLHDVNSGYGFLAAAFDAVNAPVRDPVHDNMHLHAGAAVGVVSCYTANIGVYAELHERSWLPYCQARGLGYHLYRDRPDGLPDGVVANWAKAHLLLRHMQDHEWVFWVDADVLVQNPDFPLQAWLADRQRVVAPDHCNFSFNSGVMGFARCEENAALLRDVAACIEALPDKSHVYASGGDQQIFTAAFAARGFVNADNVVSSLLASHVPYAVNEEAWTWHCPALVSPFRRAAMQLRWAQSRAAFPGVWDVPVLVEGVLG